MKLTRTLALLLAALLTVGLGACGERQAGPGAAEDTLPESQGETRTMVDGNGRTVELPDTVERIVCVGVGALRYTCYLQGGVNFTAARAAILNAVQNAFFA